MNIFQIYSAFDTQNILCTNKGCSDYPGRKHVGAVAVRVAGPTRDGTPLLALQAGSQNLGVIQLILLM